MLKKFIFFIVLFQLTGLISIASSEIIPLKKPLQSKEVTQKKLLVDVLKPLPKPIKKNELKSVEKEIIVKKEKKINLLLPRKKPQITGTKKISSSKSTVEIKKSKYFNKKDFSLARKAIAEMKKAKWQVSLKTAKKAKDQSIYNFIQWRHLLTKGNKASFFEYKSFIDKNEDYPRIGRIKYLAEHKLSTSKVSPKKIINWFNGNDPLSGFGKMILGESYVLTGNESEGIKYIKDGWTTAELSKSELMSFKKRIFSSLLLILNFSPDL